MDESSNVIPFPGAQPAFTECAVEELDPPFNTVASATRLCDRFDIAIELARRVLAMNDGENTGEVLAGVRQVVEGLLTFTGLVAEARSAP